MKKILSLSLLVLMLALLPSCGKEKDEPSGSSLVGTSWSKALFGTDNILVIEFISSNKVVGYLADQSGNPLFSMNEGSYKASGDVVNFTDFSIQYFMEKDHLSNAKISGSIMVVNYWRMMDDGMRYESDMTLHKR